MRRRKVYVLHLSHRIQRDRRLNTHLFLTARAFSASGVMYSGVRDEGLEDRIHGIVRKWGGPFKVNYVKDWKKIVDRWKKRGTVCHLTMYGINVDECLDEIPKNKDILIIVGSKKVPKEIFRSVDLNIAIGNQPHSEVAALAIFLDRLFEGRELRTKFEDAKIKIIPQKRGKKISNFLESV